MKRFTRKSDSKDPFVAVGGLGGSGTRLIALLMGEAGIDMGTDLNYACDDLTWSLLFSHIETVRRTPKQFEYLCNLYRRIRTRETLTDDDNLFLESLGERRFTKKKKILFHEKFLQDRLEHLYTPLLDGDKQNISTALYESMHHHSIGKWGWKSPQTQLYIEKFMKNYPQLKYVHVLRHGIDMAFSDNKNQLAYFGDHFGIDMKPTPKNQLKYWVKSTKHILKLAKKYKQIYVVNYDALCESPEIEIKKLCHFLKVEFKPSMISLVKPTTIGRHKQHDTSMLEVKDVSYVEDVFNAVNMLDIG